MNINKFLDQENINTLWDVISDESIFKFLSRDVQSKISQVFINNIKGFFEIERIKTTNLIDINKKYILLILNHIKKNFPQQIPNKIKILDDTFTLSKELITYEEIHTDKQSQFEKDLVKRQDDFTSAMTLNVPQVPEFADKYTDIPINEMDKMIKEMTLKRNYEVEQINSNYNSDATQLQNWLNPQKTSIKTEKFLQTSENPKKIKYINADEQLDNVEKSNKLVTWDDNVQINESAAINIDDESIFKKLKKTDVPNAIESKIKNVENEVRTLNVKLDMILEILRLNK